MARPRELSLGYLDSINTLDQFTSLESIGNLRINKCNSLKNLNGLRNVTSIDDDIDIWENDSLTNLDGLSNVNTISGEIYIDTNPLLIDFCGISNTPFDGEYKVFDNGYNPTISQLNSSENCSN